MPRFSERIGAVNPSKALQVDSMSDELRNSLWNLFLELYDDKDERYWRRVATHIATYFRKVPADELPSHDYKLRNWVKNYFLDLPWYDAYDLTEFLVHNHRGMTTISYGYGEHVRYHRVDSEGFIRAVNHILERELSGFRFVQGTLVPITTKEEIEEIDSAADEAGKLASLVRENISVRPWISLGRSRSLTTGTQYKRPSAPSSPSLSKSPSPTQLRLTGRSRSSVRRAKSTERFERASQSSTGTQATRAESATPCSTSPT